MIQQVLALALFMLVSTAACAQSKLSDEQKEAFISSYNAYKDKLNLTDSQSVRMEQINRQYLKDLKTLQNTGGSKLAKYKKFKNLNADRDAKTKKILSPEQFRIYQQHQQQVKEEFRSRRGRNSR